MLGYRDRPPKPIGNILVALWSLVGAFCGVALVASVSKRVPSFEARDATVIVGSFVSYDGLMLEQRVEQEQPKADSYDSLMIGCGGSD
jgi:hypothetical protein